MPVTVSTHPRIGTAEQVATIVTAVSPKPVNLLINVPFTVTEAAALGVRRISVGGTLARTAWAGFLLAAREIADAGTFWSGLIDTVGSGPIAPTTRGASARNCLGPIVVCQKVTRAGHSENDRAADTTDRHHGLQRRNRLRCNDSHAPARTGHRHQNIGRGLEQRATAKLPYVPPVRFPRAAPG